MHRGVGDLDAGDVLLRIEHVRVPGDGVGHVLAGQVLCAVDLAVIVQLHGVPERGVHRAAEHAADLGKILAVRNVSAEFVQDEELKVALHFGRIRGRRGLRDRRGGRIALPRPVSARSAGGKEQTKAEQNGKDVFHIGLLSYSQGRQPAGSFIP